MASDARLTAVGYLGYLWVAWACCLSMGSCGPSASLVVPTLSVGLRSARTVSERSGGAFDVTALPLLEVLERSFAERGVPPTDEEVIEEAEEEAAPAEA